VEDSIKTVSGENWQIRLYHRDAYKWIAIYKYLERWKSWGLWWECKLEDKVAVLTLAENLEELGELGELYGRIAIE
jgi:hypothetical protein